MKHFYLIDFENVSDAGLSGFFSLSAEDTAYLFYSQKANRISIDFCKTLLEHHSAAAIHFFKVSAGNQALDLQLASFLGSLIASNPTDCDFCIISKDKGYACLSSFWTNRGDSARLSQAGSIAEALSQRVKTASAAEAKPADKPVSLPASAAETALSGGEQPETDDAAPSPAAAAKTPEELPSVPAAEAMPKQSADKPENPEPTAGKDNPKASRPADVKAGKPQKTDAEKSKAQQPAKAADDPEKGKAKPAPAPQSEKSILNARIQQTLSKAKYDNTIVAQVASMTSKAFGDPKIKQLVYRGLIKQYGQKTGLEIYNLIKPLL